MSQENEIKEGFIVPLLIVLYDIGERFSIERGKRVNATTIEWYVLCWLGLETVFLGSLFLWPSLTNKWWFVFVLGFLSYRVLDILRMGFGWLIIAPYRGLTIISTPRLLILSLINYMELAVIFGVIAFLVHDGFDPQFNSAWDSFYYSVSIITTLGADSIPVSLLGRVVFLSEIGLALIFLTLIIARIVSLLPSHYNK